MKWQAKNAALRAECNSRDWPVAASAVSVELQTAASRRRVIDSINSVTRLMALTAVSLQARLQANLAMASAVDTVTGLGASFGLI